MIYLLTVNYYSTNLVAKLVSSLSTNTNIEYKIVIINNSPDDDSIYHLKSDSALVFNATDNLGFGSACNLGLKFIFAQEPRAIVWIVNPDAYLLKNALDKVYPFFDSHPEISILGTIIYTLTNEVWFAGGKFISQTGTILTQDLITNINAEYIPCDWVSGCSMIINLQKFCECPLFDPAYFLYYEDFDFCQRYVQQGHLIAVTKQFGVLHEPSSITNRYVFRKIRHSTYSYLLTLERYTNKLIFNIRLIRLVFYALVLIFFKPQIGLGKIHGLLNYWQSKF
ncbi:glycosyltransferase [Chlorogloeopsis sp. ULAP01]|uniref:glycosyltransferase n=1 Tax=Chlorogloeopsis sp. ULAP01 TaxID=3056483 RepID=UPI0025AADA8C|nr:glycosyltransferase [Chlorogloeopsis sp. ULAP01]MDM9382164.1 glycosyltransferase [Chlorogloeopsis sp. ULAP01]